MRNRLESCGNSIKERDERVKLLEIELKSNFFIIVQLLLCKSKLHLDFKGEKDKESANKEANNDYQENEQIEGFKEETKDLTDFMSISVNSSNETIAPSTSKQTEMVQSESFSIHSIQKKKVINKKRNFFRTKFAFKRRP